MFLLACYSPKPDHGAIDHANFTFTSNITVTCDDGYELTGDKVISCKANGQWTDQPQCTPVGEL